MFDENRLKWPANGDINAWADFVETLCILNIDGVMSIEDFTEWLTDDPLKTTVEILSAVNFNEDFLAPLYIAPNVHVATANQINPNDDGDFDNEEEEEDEEGFDGIDVENGRKESVRSRLISLFNFLKARKAYFGNYYPFEVSEVDLTISVFSVAEQTSLQKVYQILLFSSEMQLYSKADIHQLGHMFEAFCARPFGQLLPGIAEKRFFGAGAGTILAADYAGNLRARLEALAIDLCCKTKSIIDDPDEISKSGDAGLDWVGWVSFEDECNRQPIYFGQCACGTDWVDKQHETSPSHWNNFIDINQPLQCFHFMPRSFRRNSLAWFRETKIIYGLGLIDRYRLLRLISLERNEDIEEIILPYDALLTEANNFELE